MPKQDIERLVATTIESLNGIKRAEPKPFLLTRVMAAIADRTESNNVWTKLGVFISTPRIAFTGLLLVLLINTSIFYFTNSDRDTTIAVQYNSLVRDEYGTATIYDIEINEP